MVHPLISCEEEFVISMGRRVALLTLLTVVLPGCSVFDVIQGRKLAREGNDLYRQYDYRGAIEKYRKAIDLDPGIPNIYLNLGYSYFSIYDPSSKSELDRSAAELAVEAFDEHIRHVPEDENAKNFQIKMFLKAAPYSRPLSDRAYQTFLSLLSKNPKDTEARQYLVTLFIDCKRYEDSVAFFEQELLKNPDDIETMKILAIIADKSDKIQEAVDWYWRRAERIQDPEKKAVLFYEVGTYAWNLLHYAPDRATGTSALKIADQGIEACRNAMALKENYAEAMIYANLLYLKRFLYETEEQGQFFDQALAFELRSAAGKILTERKRAKEGTKEDPTPGTAGATEKAAP
jgi:tetratricopeptide (TPR) repeat protein